MRSYPVRRDILSMAAGTFAGGVARASGDGPGRPKDQARPIPLTTTEGPALDFDFPSLRIGVAEYAEGPTGCTVFSFPKGSRCAVDVRGGSPGTMMAGDGAIDALCFAGGSLYGLEAASGVASELFATRDHSTRWDDIAIVRAAVIFDFASRATAPCGWQLLHAAGRSGIKMRVTQLVPPSIDPASEPRP